MSNQTDNIERSFYSEKQLIQKLGLSRSTLWRMRRAGEFPNPVHISKGRVGYVAAQVHAFIQSRLEGAAA